MSNSWTDFRKPNVISNFKKTITSTNDGYWIGNVKYNNKHFVTQGPWLRTTSGWTSQDSQFGTGKNYSLSFSMYPIQEGTPANTAMVEDFRKFIDATDDDLIEYVKENWETFMPDEELPNDETLREFLTTIVQEERPPYPECYKFKMNDMVEKDNFIGGVFEQTYDADNEKLLPGHKQSKIENVRKHARVRFQVVLKSFYISVYDEEVLGETIKKIRFGNNWMVQKILFYNVLGTLTDETTLKSFTFGDINVDESYSPDTTDGGAKVKVVEKRQRVDDGVLDGLTGTEKKGKKKVKAV